MGRSARIARGVCGRSPVRSVPDPTAAPPEEVKEALLPAVLVEVVVDNHAHERARKFVFGYRGSDPYSNMRSIGIGGDEYVGVGQGLSTAIVTDAHGAGAVAALGFSLADVLAVRPGDANRTFGLGDHAGVVLEVRGGEVATFRFAVAFYRGGVATAGMAGKYWYTRFFPSVEKVAEYALLKFNALAQAAIRGNALVAGAAQLSADQAWQLKHAVRSYYGSTALLEVDGQPWWVVYEGEYRMMNTFDLTVDQMFWELRMNPWTVRNVLDSYVKHYSYTDSVVLPGDDAVRYPGGLAFTHDQGVGNVFAPAGRSAYEQGGLRGLFSVMAHEQLVNWVLVAAAYVARMPEDGPWLQRSASLFKAALASLQARPPPPPRLGCAPLLPPDAGGYYCRASAGWGGPPVRPCRCC